VRPVEPDFRALCSIFCWLKRRCADKAAARDFARLGIALIIAPTYYAVASNSPNPSPSGAPTTPKAAGMLLKRSVSRKAIMSSRERQI